MIKSITLLFSTLLWTSFAEGNPSELVHANKKVEKVVSDVLAPSVKVLSQAQNISYEFKVKLSSMNMGRLTYKVNKEKDKVFTEAYLKTSSFYDFIFKIRDKLTSVYSTSASETLSFNFNKKEGRRSSDVKMIFKNGKVEYSENWKKKKRTGKKEKIVDLERIKHFDILSIINIILFSKNELKKGMNFNLSLKDKLYIVRIENIQSTKRVFKKKEYPVNIYRLKTFKGKEVQDKGSFEIIVAPGKRPLFLEIKGRLKVGKLLGKLENVH